MSLPRGLVALAGLLVAGWLVWLLAPVLSPFVTAALLAYLADPLVDALERRGLRRTLAVCLVFGALVLAALVGVLLVVPLLERQVAALVAWLPRLLEWVQGAVLPRLAALTGEQLPALDPALLREALSSHWKQVGGVMAGLLGTVTQSGSLLLSWFAFLTIVPVVTFYLLRDWDHLMAGLRSHLPRRWEPTVVRLATECDAVLAEFLRGQLLVMLCLGVVYALGLWLVGLDLAFLIGLVAGLVSFVPYLGVIVGLLLASLAAVMQFQELLPLVWVALVFVAGQSLEGMVLSPLLVGERIGLHPVAVIFAVMAGGQLFGFVGVLLALPVAAVLVVLIRHSRELYLQSGFYGP